MRAGIEPAGQTLRKEVIAFARRLSRPLRSPSRDAPQASKPHRQDCLACLLLENPPVGLWHACSDRQNDAGVESSGGSAPAGEMKKPIALTIEVRRHGATSLSTPGLQPVQPAGRVLTSQGTQRVQNKRGCVRKPQRTQCRAVTKRCGGFCWALVLYSRSFTVSAPSSQGQKAPRGRLLCGDRKRGLVF